MDELQFFQSLREKNQADKRTLYLLGKIYKEKRMYQDALTVFIEAMAGDDAELNPIILNEITTTSVLQSSAQGTDIEEEDAEEDIDDYTPGVIKMFPQSDPDKVTFKDVGGLAELKRTIDMKIIKPFQHPEMFARFKKKSGGGIMLYGPPGCGKTFMSKATAGECGAYFRSVGLTDVLSPYMGVSEENLSNIFSTARKRKPCVLFFDELDTLGFNRAKSAAGTTRSVVNQLLVELEGIDTNTDKLLVIGATNMPWDVDEALRRPGRFDRAVFVYPPDIEAREEIFKLKLSGRPIDTIDYSILAMNSEFFSGADIEYAVEIAAEKVLEEIVRTGNHNLKITMKILLEVMSGSKPSTLGWLKTVSTYVKYANQTGYYNDVEDYLKANKMSL